MTSLGLSDVHIEAHVLQFTRLSQQAGYHGGLSLNAHAALMCEPYERVLSVLDNLTKAKRANPFGCSITLCPIWYVEGISRHWNTYGGKSFGSARNGSPILEYTTVYNEARYLAEKYPNQAFGSNGEPSVAELIKVRTKLGLPLVLTQMANDACLICEATPIVPQATTLDDPFAGDDEDFDEEDDDDPDFDEEEAPF